MWKMVISLMAQKPNLSSRQRHNKKAPYPCAVLMSKKCVGGVKVGSFLEESQTNIWRISFQTKQNTSKRYCSFYKMDAKVYLVLIWTKHDIVKLLIGKNSRPALK